MSSPGVAARLLRTLATTIRLVERTESEEWLAMRAALFSDSDTTELRDEIDRYFEGTALEVAVFIAWDESSRPLGMIELALRPYAEGCRSSPVPYLEAWYVIPEARRNGIGTLLIDQAVKWAKEHGHTEIASDSLLDNHVSYKSHLNNGFEEVERAIHYRKLLD